jgi:glycosyltransferase involved in cell wall biosynthesis/ubiquinone/menaquinone biosynthesis C-methylase UbiE
MSDSPRIRLLALVNKATGIAPNQRYRLEQWAPHLASEHGIEIDFVPFESPQLTRVLYEKGRYATKAAWVFYDFIRRFGAVRRARRYDGVVVSREASLIGPALYERLLPALGLPLIYDFDDAIWSPQQLTAGEARNGPFAKLHFFGKTSTICRIATAVTPGNEYLANYARQRNANVTVVPSSIELADYPVQPELPDDGPFVICWTGSTSTLAHFEFARPALERIAAQRPTEVRVICSEPPAQPIAGAKTTFVRWNAATEARDVGACHVGIMPLPDDEVTRGKCGMKALQYMATGRPVVVSPVGMNVDLVQDGANGLLASTTDDFVEALTKIAENPALRWTMGQAARRTVEDQYSAKEVAASFARVARDAVGSADVVGRLPTPGASNIDPKTVEGFGKGWASFDQSGMTREELREVFDAYFEIFPFEDLPPDAEGFDLGCGSGRWADLMAERVGTLHCIDPAAEALAVAERRLRDHPNVELHCASVDAMPLADASQDFGYSLGVLHHVPDTAAAIASCARKLKPGAPFLVYLYYRFDNRPAWFRGLWHATDIVRRPISRAPFAIRKATTEIIAVAVYWPLARLSRRLEKSGRNVSSFPLSMYRRRSFYTMRTDALDRFGTRLEKRFTRKEIEAMMKDAGLVDIRFKPSEPYWVACGRKA